MIDSNPSSLRCHVEVRGAVNKLVYKKSYSYTVQYGKNLSYLLCLIRFDVIKSWLWDNKIDCHCSASIDEIFDAEREPIKYRDIFEHFEAKQCPLLAGKPKLFFLQSCRGSELSVKCALLYVKNTVRVKIKEYIGWIFFKGGFWGSR